jgi:endonuclease YncB( thermonuclease family)
VLRRCITHLIAPAFLGALLLTGSLEIAVDFLRVDDGPLDPVTAEAPTGVRALAALPVRPVDTLTTASTHAPEPRPVPSSPEASATVTLAPPYTVLDGRTLSSRNITVTLAGIEGPAARAICLDGKRQKWACGLQARAALSKLVRQRNLRCRPAQSGAGPALLSECSMGDEDLARTLVRQGWARPTRERAIAVQPEIEVARRARAGLWNGNWMLVEAEQAEAPAKALIP